MTKIGEYEFPDDLYYTKEHVWARVDGTVATIGISHFGQALSGEIVFVEVPMVGRKVTMNEPFMSMESGKWVGRVKSPVSGKIVEANGEIEWESTLVNQEPYGKGWLAKIEMADPADLGTMMKANSSPFGAFITSERGKYNK